jgi:hypothetical protein
VREVHQRPDQRAQYRVAGDPVDQGPVQLDDVRCRDDDVPQRGEPGADVVDRQPHAALPERCERASEGVVVLHQVVLRELEEDPLDRQPGEQLAALGGRQRPR